jgi:probable HAF family extracellular repeat protein
MMCDWQVPVQMRRFAAFLGLALVWSGLALPPAQAAELTNTGIDYVMGATPDASIVVGYRTYEVCPSLCVTVADAQVFEGGVLSVLPGDPGATLPNSTALGISPSGSPIVGTSWGTDPFNPARWDAGVLTVLQGVGDHSVYAASADGSVLVGEDGFEGSNPSSSPIRWENGGAPEDLGTLGGSGAERANDVSADGTIIVGVASAPAGPEAFRHENGTLTGLGGLPGAPHDSGALAISADGSVIVGHAVNTSSNRRAVRWTQSGIEVLGPDAIKAWAVSGDGTYIAGEGASGAFVWDAAHGVRYLTDLLESQGVDTTGVTLLRAISVSDDGLVLVAQGAPDGYIVKLDAPFVPSVPALSPAGGLAVVAGLLAVGALAARRVRRTG